MPPVVSRLLPAALAALAGCCPSQELSPLMAAARSGDTGAMRRLLAAGADPNARGGANGWTPLLHAIHKNQLASVQVLLDAGADVNAATRSGTTGLMMAAGYGQADIVRELLRRGANPYARARDGGTALAAAVGGVPDIDRFTFGDCQTETVRSLLERAPDLRLGRGVRTSIARLAATAAGCGEVLRLIRRQAAAPPAAR